MNPFEEDDCECDCQLSDLHYTVAYTCQQQLNSENDAKLVQSLYKQLNLQRAIRKDDALNPVIKQDILYTNKALIGQMGDTILQKNINLPSSYMKLTQDYNTNIILDAMQNRAVHINNNPFGQ